ncbi:MAG: 2Fe-2S iron-sulfur cluster-binding protein [Pseudomonadota bacterium]
MIRLTIDGRAVTAATGADLLSVCLASGIFVPHLCYLPESPEPGGACRLCLVEVAGAVRPLCACTVTATEGMEVFTNTARVRELQKSALRLLLSAHHIDCAACAANRRCGLQDTARFLGIGLTSAPHPGLLANGAADTTHPQFDYLPHRCILCGKCIRICRKHHPNVQLSFAGRGFKTLITSFGITEKTAAACAECLACIRVCPVGALLLKDGSLPEPAPGGPP